jgi:hypothetical protein
MQALQLMPPHQQRQQASLVFSQELSTQRRLQQQTLPELVLR